MYEMKNDSCKYIHREIKYVNCYKLITINLLCISYHIIDIGIAYELRHK